MNVYLNGFDRKEVTFNASVGLKEGSTVNFLSKSTVGPSATDGNFCGVCVSVRNGMASVVFRGYVTVSYTDTAPTLGYIRLASNGMGGVKVSDNGRHVLVADVDTINKTCGIVL